MGRKLKQEGRGKYTDINEFKQWLIEKAEYMKTSRPTAVNLMWACEKQIEIIKNSRDSKFSDFKS